MDNEPSTIAKIIACTVCCASPLIGLLLGYVAATWFDEVQLYSRRAGINTVRALMPTAVVWMISGFLWYGAYRTSVDYVTVPLFPAFLLVFFFSIAWTIRILFRLLPKEIAALTSDDDTSYGQRQRERYDGDIDPLPDSLGTGKKKSRLGKVAWRISKVFLTGVVTGVGSYFGGWLAGLLGGIVVAVLGIAAEGASSDGG